MQLGGMAADIHRGLALNPTLRAVAVLAKSPDMGGKWFNEALFGNGNGI